MSGPYAALKYLGATPGADANTYVLVATTLPAAPTDAMNMNRDGACPECFSANVGARKLCLTLDHVQAGTLNFYASQNRGTTWRQIDTVAAAAPAASGSTVVEFLIEGLRDWKLEWVNGGVAQNPWEVNLSLSPDRASAL